MALISVGGAVIVAAVTVLPVLMNRKTAKGIGAAVGKQNGHGSMMDILASVMHRMDELAHSVRAVIHVQEVDTKRLERLESAFIEVHELVVERHKGDTGGDAEYDDSKEVA